MTKKSGRKDRSAAKSDPPRTFAQALRVDQGFVLADLDPESTPGFPGGKALGEKRFATRASGISELQERLFAESREGGRRSLLLVIQGMDTSGKGGLMRHVVGQADPQGVRHTAFKAPSAEEREHDFLWRIRKALPVAGEIGVFDRSHYEDVLIVRVHDIVPRAEWMTRYDLINAFEREVAASGTTIVKVMLHISKDEQKLRLAERLDRPDKYWKYNPGDIAEREHWDDYMTAYQAALSTCSTLGAPWYVVPANRKWYARLAVQELLIEALEQMDPQWPAADFDIAVEKSRLAAS
ncbi:MAG TPA: polyphosphate kinase 2 family protein [Candidatus Lustribacter sp.]|nr:polyphosphate kinase 2 family protein [Candidatus Lustribacter sp.]